MDQQELIIEPPLTICNFFARLLHRFIHGNAPYTLHANQFHESRVPPYQFPFDCHPGPITDAISDAQNLHRSLFLFIYSQDNPATKPVVSLLQEQSVMTEIRDNFIFLPLDVTWPEGWEIATELQFKRMPLIALVRPQGQSLAESQVFVTYEGKVGESALLSSMRVEHHERNPDVELIQDQDDEYHQAVLIDQENIRRTQDEIDAGQTRAIEMEIMKRSVDEEFEQIPEPKDSADRAVIRFQFPAGIATQTRKFSREASVRWVFVFVRKFMFPKEFALFTGFPQTRIEENNRALGEVCPEKQFIVYVQEQDDDE
jgi:hypothetical protein